MTARSGSSTRSQGGVYSARREREHHAKVRRILVQERPRRRGAPRASEHGGAVALGRARQRSARRDRQPDRCRRGAPRPRLCAIDGGPRRGMGEGAADAGGHVGSGSPHVRPTGRERDARTCAASFARNRSGPRSNLHRRVRCLTPWARGLRGTTGSAAVSSTTGRLAAARGASSSSTDSVSWGASSAAPARSRSSADDSVSRQSLWPDARYTRPTARENALTSA